MDALTLLLNRRSSGKLVEPAPAGEALKTMFQAAMRVPDHGLMRPYRFIVIEGEGRQRLSEVMQQVAVDENKDEKIIEKAKQTPLKAPMIIAVIAHCEQHPKVPKWEQVATASCAVMALQMAAVAQGFGGIWRTGFWAENPLVKTALGCRQQDELVGFLYLGTPEILPTPPSSPDITPFISYF